MKKLIISVILITPIVLYCMQPPAQQGAQPSSAKIQPAIHPGTFGKLYNKNVYGALVALKKKLPATFPEHLVLEILGHYLKDSSVDRRERINVALEFIADPEYALYQNSLIDLLYSIPDLAFQNTQFNQPSPLQLAQDFGYSSQVIAKLSPEDIKTQNTFFQFLSNNNLGNARQMLKNKDINIHRKNPNGMTLLNAVISRYQYLTPAEIIKKIRPLLEYGADINDSGSDSLNPLLLTRSPELVQFLLAQGLNPNIKVMYRGQLTPLIHLIYYDPAIIQRLAQAGVDMNARDDRGETPLMRVMSNMNTGSFDLDKQRTIEALINAGAEVNAKDNYGRTAMHTAAFRHDIPMIELLHRNGASMNILDDIGQSPLAYVMWTSDRTKILPTVQALIANGANVNFYDKNSSYQAPLVQAIQHNLPDVVRFLLIGGASLGNDSSWIIKNIENPEMVQTLIAGGFDINALDTNGETSLTNLTNSYGSSILTSFKNILAFKPDVNKQNKFGDTPLSQAVARFIHTSPSDDDTLAITQVLIDAGADVNKGGQRGRTPLMNVIQAAGNSRNPELAIPVVQLLLSKGANPLQRDHDGINAILGAVLFNQGNILELLTKDAAILRAFAQKDVPTLAARLIDANVNKNALLALIAMYARPEQQTYLNRWAQYLLDHGANPNMVATVSRCSDETEPVLQSALIENNIELAKLLLAKGANINIQNPDGNTMLMQYLTFSPYEGCDDQSHSESENEESDACSCSPKIEAEKIEFLITHGIDLTIKNKNGETALDLARKNGHTQAAEQIEKALAAQKSQPTSVSGEQPCCIS